MWSFATGGPVHAPPARWKKHLYVGSDDKHLYCLSTRTGRKRWSLETGGPLRSSPVVFENAVFAVSYDLILYALRSDNGHRLWNAHLTGRVEEPPLVTTFGLAVKPIFSREIHLYGMGDGMPRGTYTLPGHEDYFTSELLYANERLYVGTYGGRVLALDFVEVGGRTDGEGEEDVREEKGGRGKP